jgi:arylsulfatase A-like enzyme
VFQRLGLHQFLVLPFDIVWMAPIVDFLWLLLPTLLLILARRLAPGKLSFAGLVGILGGLAALPLFLLVTSMHKAVALVLAVGVGIQLSRLMSGRELAVAAFMRRTLPLLGILFAGAAALVLSIESLNERAASHRWPAASQDKPNVLLLVWDTVRNDELSVAGYARPTTPFLESVAREGVRFEHAFSTAPWTLPSHVSMFTGQWPFMFFRGTRAPVEMPTPTLAEELSRAGYRTGGFTANLDFTTRAHGIHKGFAHYEDFTRTMGTALAWSRISWVILDQQWVRRIIGYYEVVDRKRADVINTSFLRWLDRDGSRPFFAFLNYFDAHEPYIAPSPFRERFAHGRRGTYEMFPEPGKGGRQPRTPEAQRYWRDEYDALIASLDDATRSLFAELARRGLLDHTIVIITSDHGEQFGEHGKLFHMNSLYRVLLEVPLLIRFPPAVPANRSIPAPVSIRDIPRTVLTLTGVAADSVPGRSLTRFWKPEPAAPDSLILAEMSTSSGRNLGPHAVLSNGLFYIRRGKDSVELYQLLDDPSQSTNLYRDSTRSGDLARFRHVTDSLAALYRRSHTTDEVEEEDEQ